MENLFDQWIQTIQNGQGFTSDLVGRKPLHGYAVGISKETEYKLPFQENTFEYAYHLQEYIRTNIISLINGAYLGAWIDIETSSIVFDISEVVNDKETAIRLCIERNQDAMWDIENNVEVRVEKFVDSWLTD